MKQVELDELKYVIFPTHSSEKIWSLAYEEAFRCWKKVWTDTLKELDGSDSVFSDDFCRQSYAGCLFHKGRCLALGLFHSVDFHSASARCDSYFKVWPETALNKLLEDGQSILVGSNITVDKEFRGNLGNGLQMKNLLVGLMVTTFLHSTSDAMTGTMRVNRNMHQAARKFGAVSLCQGIFHHGVEVELSAFYRRRLRPDLIIDVPIETLWTSRLDFRKGKEEIHDRYKEAR